VASFHGSASFSGARFGGLADFTMAWFGINLLLADAAFRSGTEFHGATLGFDPPDEQLPTGWQSVPSLEKRHVWDLVRDDPSLQDIGPESAIAEDSAGA
jgi:hypothetical protein